MIEKCATLTEEELRISLVLYDLPASMLKEFLIRIVKPYFNGNLNEAIKKLIDKAIIEETIIKKVKKP